MKAKVFGPQLQEEQKKKSEKERSNLRRRLECPVGFCLEMRSSKKNMEAHVMSEKDHPQYSKEELWEILEKWLEEREEKMKGHRGKGKK